MTSPSSPIDEPEESASGQGRQIPYGKLVLGIGVLAALLYLGRSAGGYVPVFAEWVDGLGPRGPIVFILGYAIAVVAFIPGSLLTLAAGAIFGLAEGTLYVILAATLGATLAFLIARHGARAAIERRIQGDERFAAIDRAVGAEGRKIVFLLRLSPVFPFNLLNYALGLTRVRLLDYFVASIGMLPGTLLYVYTGKVAGEVAAVAGGRAGGKGVGDLLVLVLGLAATAAVTVFVTRIARRALANATDQDRTDAAADDAHDKADAAAS
jgi:uncharacterized membrane protein YdjX (TVP38/TMEM64 family)